MQRHKYILKYLRQDNGGSFVVKLGAGIVLGLLLLGLTLSIRVPGATVSATSNPCGKGTHGYTTVQGDTLSWIAFRYHMDLTELASQNHVSNASVIYTGQVVCIPVQKFSPSARLKNIYSIGHMARVRKAPARKPPTKPAVRTVPTAAPQPIVTPVVVAPTKVPQPVVTPVVVAPTKTPIPQPTMPPAPTGSIPALIDSIFGAYGPAAINVARCESGLNPGAYNPSGASGLFQIMPGTFAGTSEAGQSIFNAQANALAAHEIFVRDGYSWREWTCQP